MTIFYIQYKAIPSDVSKAFKTSGGAYISCWVKATSIEVAKAMAERAINQNQWIILNLEEAFFINDEHYEEDEESLEFYQQAIIDGEVYVYDTWPNEKQDGEQVH